MIVKENVNQNSLSIMKNTAIFQIILKIKQKDYSNMGGNHIRNLKNDFKELLSLNISYESIRKYIFCGWIHYIGVMMNQNSLDILAMTHNGLCQRVNSGYRLDIFDTIRNMPVAYQISIMNQMKLLKILLTKAYPLKYRKAIITDSKQGYDENNE